MYKRQVIVLVVVPVQVVVIVVCALDVVEVVVGFGEDVLEVVKEVVDFGEHALVVVVVVGAGGKGLHGLQLLGICLLGTGPSYLTAPHGTLNNPRLVSVVTLNNLES